MAENSGMTVEAMKQVEQSWAAANSTVDIDSLMALYADDATFDFLNAEPAEPAVGKDAIRAAFQAMEDEGDSTPRDKTTIEPREAVVMGDWGYTSGTWMVEHSDGRVDSGTYLHVFKLIDGEVKLFRHMPYMTGRSYPASQQG